MITEQQKQTLVKIITEGIEGNPIDDVYFNHEFTSSFDESGWQLSQYGHINEIIIVFKNKADKCIITSAKKATFI